MLWSEIILMRFTSRKLKMCVPPRGLQIKIMILLYHGERRLAYSQGFRSRLNSARLQQGTSSRCDYDRSNQKPVWARWSAPWRPDAKNEDRARANLSDAMLVFISGRLSPKHGNQSQNTNYSDQSSAWTKMAAWYARRGHGPWASAYLAEKSGIQKHSPIFRKKENLSDSRIISR